MTVKRVQHIRMNPQDAADFTGLEGEFIVEKDSWMIRVQDGLTPGGFATLTETNARALFLTQAQFDQEIESLQETLTNEINNNFTELAGEILVAIGPVKSIVTAPPGSPAPGDRYLVAHSGTSGAFAGQEDQVAQWNGSTWEFSGTPLVGHEVFVQSVSKDYYYDGTTWTTGNPDVTLSDTFTSIQNQLNAKAPLDDPVFTGTPIAPTPTVGDNSQRLATTAFVKTAIDAIAGDIGGDFANNLVNDGWQKFPGGFIIQWVHGAVDTPGQLENVQTVAFPIAFPTACFLAVVAMQVAATGVVADFWYQTVGAPTLGSVTIQRQRPSEGGLNVNTVPLIIAVGH